VWFIANWSYNASLAYTSISSSTVLASTSSLFTFVFAVACRDEHFSILTLCGVLLGVLGSILTGIHDYEGKDDPFHNHNNNSTDNADNNTSTRVLLFQDHYSIVAPPPIVLLMGDFLSLLSAIGYAVQVMLIRVLCPRDETRMSMQLLLGYVGLINAVLLSPVALYQLWQKSSSSLNWTIFGCLVLKGLLDNVLSDYLWARAVVLTTATVATVGLGLTIPLAFVSDWVLERRHGVASLSSIAGAVSILMGFILVNVGNSQNGNSRSSVVDDVEEEEEEEEEASSEQMVAMANASHVSESQRGATT
jgi:solute carrier family 35 protein F5